MKTPIETSRIAASGAMSDSDLTTFISKTIMPIEDGERRVLLKGTVWLLAYLHHIVRIGLWQDGKLLFDGIETDVDPNHLKEMRVFSENGELYIWKQDTEFRFRLRLDNDSAGKEVHVYQETHYMWGNSSDAQKPGWVSEGNRGMAFHFPVPVTQEQLPLRYEVCNYYNFDDEITPDGTGQIQFYDARLLNFLDGAGQSFRKEGK